MKKFIIGNVILLVFLFGSVALKQSKNEVPLPVSSEISQIEIDAFLGILLDPNTSNFPNYLDTIESHWQLSYVPIVLEIINFVPSEDLANHFWDLLRTKTGHDFGTDTNEWFFWWWGTDRNLTDGYDNFKAEFYRNIDPRFEAYFRERFELARVDLDEIRWGGVLRDGIPPLRNPEMLQASEADYLDDGDVVFGIAINGDFRAYPKRILAWHEMFVDTVGGVDLAGVYCTLCGAVILYETEVEGVKHALGTSGFLYRSNKLMYDQATQSLWNTIAGVPVLGPLVDQGISLKSRSVVTTTWGEWKRRHPETQVLSLKTGHSRDYGEGVAYNQYFATDQLMFNTPFRDDRLNNKQEVLALRFEAHPNEQLAIDTAFLETHPIYSDTIGNQSFVVLTDQSGANRVYDNTDVTFVEYDQDSTVIDDNGVIWTLTEAALSAEGQQLERLPYHRAFWFGWHATFPESRLIK